MIPVPLIAFPIGLLAALLLSGGTGYWGYNHGMAIQEARQTKAELKAAEEDLADYKKGNEKAAEAGKKFEDAKPIIVHDVHDRIREVHIPPDADPLLPVWFVRMFDRLASGDPAADSYPAQPDGAPSRVRLSRTRPVLEAWVVKYETCVKQVDDTHDLNPVLPQPTPKEENFLGKLIPF